MEKKPFPKKTTIVHAHELGFDYDVSFEVWKDPSTAVITGILQIMTEDLEILRDTENPRSKQVSDAYFSAVSEYIIDSDIEGLDFSTPEQAQESHMHPSLPWGFLQSVVVLLMGKLFEESESLKKALAELGADMNSGSDSEEKEQKSVKTS